MWLIRSVPDFSPYAEVDDALPLGGGGKIAKNTRLQIIYHPRRSIDKRSNEASQPRPKAINVELSSDPHIEAEYLAPGYGTVCRTKVHFRILM